MRTAIPMQWAASSAGRTGRPRAYGRGRRRAATSMRHRRWRRQCEHRHPLRGHCRRLEVHTLVVLDGAVNAETTSRRRRRGPEALRCSVESIRSDLVS